MANKPALPIFAFSMVTCFVMFYECENALCRQVFNTLFFLIPLVPYGPKILYHESPIPFFQDIVSIFGRKFDECHDLQCSMFCDVL
jgi:hypothetical protein